MTTPSPAPDDGRRPRPGSAWARRVSAPVQKLAAIGVVVVLTAIATGMVSGVIEDRAQRQQGVQEEFQSSWGPQQLLRGPLLVIPYRIASGGPRSYLKLAPAQLAAAVRLSPESRHRGVFHATLYTASVDLKGSFAVPGEANLAESLGPEAAILWSEAFVILESAGLSGLAASDGLTWNGTALPWRSCRAAVAYADDCRNIVAVLARTPLAAAANGTTDGVPSSLDPVAAAQPAVIVPFQATLTLRGSGGLALTVQGKAVEASMTAPWPTPSFSGTLLPTSSTVTDTGFEATWQAVQYASPQSWTSGLIIDQVGEGTVAAGVDLLEATPTYRTIHRAAKYNILFVALCFTTYYLFELMTGARIHVVHYGLLGLSLSLFALLLLSFSEPLGYVLGYTISAALVLVQASLFTATMARRRRDAVLFTVMLATSFGFLFVLIGLETYSLLLGSVALFVALSVVMVLSRHIDWSGEARLPASATV
ncbi:MAG: cell envelope integrity protein CreD [Azospirillum sp.]|nr:cell envelope integrity protein CreD [Azospirillum sp.]